MSESESEASFFMHLMTIITMKLELSLKDLSKNQFSLVLCFMLMNLCFNCSVLYIEESMFL